MTAQNPPYALQGATGINHPAELFRRLTRALAAKQTGILSVGDLAVTANGTPNMTVNVAKGEAFVAGTATADQGTYYCFNDGTVNLAIAAADLTNPRIDLVVAKVVDTLSDADVWSLAVVTGTPAGSPTAPAAPGNSLVLAQVAVAANATSITSGNITDKRQQLTCLCRVHLVTDYLMPAAASNNIIPYTGVDTDTYGGFNTTSHQYTAPLTGWYEVSSQNELRVNNNPEQAWVGVYVNGAIAGQGGQLLVRGGTTDDPWPLQLPTRRVYATAGQTIDIRVNHTTGTNASNIKATPAQPASWMEIHYLGPA